MAITKESLDKRKATKKDGLKQLADIEDTETILRIDYRDKQLVIYTNRATVMNRLDRLGYKPTKEDVVDGQVYGRFYSVPSKSMSEFLKGTIFKFD